VELPVGELMVEKLNFLDLKMLTGMENLVFGGRKGLLNFLEILQHVVSVSRGVYLLFPDWLDRTVSIHLLHHAREKRAIR
jgi:hypothetical protein